MMTDPVEKILADADNLISKGRYEEALHLFKNAVSESDNLHVRFIAARGIVWIIVDHHRGEMPPPASPQNYRMGKYLQIALDSFDSADSAMQRSIRESFDVDALREMVIPLKMAQAGNLEEIGKPEEAIMLLKEIVAQTDNLTDRLFAAGLIPSIMRKHFPEAADDPSSKRYRDLREYLGIALECYDQADQDVQAAFRKVGNDVNNLKYWLTQMEKGQPVGSDVGKKRGCFIATAIYGSYNAPEVIILRHFRDKILLTTDFGKLIVKLYYMLSPLIAPIIDHSHIIKNAIKIIILDPIVTLISKRK